VRGKECIDKTIGKLGLSRSRYVVEVVGERPLGKCPNVDTGEVCSSRNRLVLDARDEVLDTLVP